MDRTLAMGCNPTVHQWRRARKADEPHKSPLHGNMRELLWRPCRVSDCIRADMTGAPRLLPAASSAQPRANSPRLKFIASAAQLFGMIPRRKDSERTPLVRAQWRSSSDVDCRLLAAPHSRTLNTAIPETSRGVNTP